MGGTTSPVTTHNVPQTLVFASLTISRLSGRLPCSVDDAKVVRYVKFIHGPLDGRCADLALVREAEDCCFLPLVSRTDVDFDRLERRVVLGGVGRGRSVVLVFGR